jgi:hypothetical protein
VFIQKDLISTELGNIESLPTTSNSETSRAVTPCLSTNVFNGSKEFCVLVAVLPGIVYHSESLYSYWNTGTGERKKRQTISALTIATLLSLGVAGAGTSIASLATQHKGMSSLRVAIEYI